jgi:hypothetical protein
MVTKIEILPSGKVEQFVRQKDQTQFEIPYELG